MSASEALPSCAIWGVLNVTPDSFSDGGAYGDLAAALRAAEDMLASGAHVLDVGGESTRPKGKTYGEGAQPVSLEEEIRRVLPVTEALVRLGAVVSVDTTKAQVARRACDVGARYINDVSCGRSEPLLRVAADTGAELVLMHNRGQGERAGGNIAYGDVVAEVRSELLEAVGRAVAAGVERERIWIDPGLGFAKTASQSLKLVANLRVLLETGHRVLVGPSRKSFIAEAAKGPTGAVPGPLERVGGTAAVVGASVMQGVQAVRVHDVAEMRQASLVAIALREARG